MPADVGGRATCGAAWLSSTINNFTQDSPSHLAADTRARDVRFVALASVILAGTAFLRVAKAQDNPAPRIESNTRTQAEGHRQPRRQDLPPKDLPPSVL